MRVLLTGAAGFIGFHVTKALLDRGDEVVGIDNLSDYYDPKLKEARLELLDHERFTFLKHDLEDPITIGSSFDVICHLAAQAGVRYSIENPRLYEQSNALGTLNVFEFARQHHIHRVVFASSSSVYGNTKVPFREDAIEDRPISLYAATKRANELYAYTYHHLFGIKMTGLRFFTVYGPWGRPDMAYYSFTKAILDGKPIDVFNRGDQSRDFTYITDIVQGVLAAIDTPFDYEIINLGRGRPERLFDFIAQIERVTGRTATKNLLPAQPGDVAMTYADISKAKRLFGYDPKVDLDEGIGSFVDWFRSKPI